MNKRTETLFTEAHKKAKEYSFFEKIPVVFRLIKQWKAGKFKPNSKNKWIIILGLIYIISPIDLIPNLIFPIIGFTDDLAVLVIVFSRLNIEIENFLNWENSNQKVEIIDTEVIIEK